jgi:putative transposase
MTRPRRLGAADYMGHRAYFLTICTHNRTRSFTDPAIVALVLRQILRAAAGQHIEILAYCFMPDHLHLIVIAHRADTDLQRFVRLAKQYSGFAFTRATGRRLWQDSYFDRTVRNVEELPALVEYAIRNPLRAGLARTPADYPHWGSQRYSREELMEFTVSASRV